MSKLRFFVVLFIIAGSFALAAQEKPMTNADVISMVKAGSSVDLILRFIMTRPNEFKIATDQVLELKGAGVSEKIIMAMMDCADGAKKPLAAVAAPVEQPVTASPAPQPSTTVPSGLEVQLRVLTALNSKTAQQGDVVEMEVAEDVTVGKQVVISHGSKATGYVVGAMAQGAFGVAGRLTIVAKSIDAPDGSKINVFGRLTVNPGFSMSKRSYYGGFAHGKAAKVAEGTTIVAQTL